MSGNNSNTLIFAVFMVCLLFIPFMLSGVFKRQVPTEEEIVRICLDSGLSALVQKDGRAVCVDPSGRVIREVGPVKERKK